MLTYLQISDFALIDSIEVEFRPGFNVLTGETGAGKTVLVGAIGLLLGDRADSMQVRNGAGAARFSSIFDLSALPRVRQALVDAGFIDGGEDELLLGRTVSRDGKSRCTINGRLSPVSALSEVGEMLVEVHGQNTHQALLKTSTHLEHLDRFIGGEHLEILQEYSKHFARLKSLIAERAGVRDAGRDLDREVELLAGEIEAIDRTEPRPGEIEELEADARRMRHARELWELALRVENALSADDRSSFTVRQLLTQAAKDLRGMAAHDGSVVGMAERLESLVYEADDVAAEVARYREALDTDPAQLEEVESRLSLLRDLCRRYAETVEGVLEYRSKAVNELEALEETRRRAGVVDSEIENELAEVAELAAELARRRVTGARRLEKAVVRELAQLELSGARFEVSIREREGSEESTTTGRYGSSGSSEVEFMFSSDGSGTARPLKRIASGGEMSRVMLALKIVLADADRLPILIFDEVDAGIGGETAGKVGEKLRQLTSYHQVFCITHIPQIATFADWQYRVFKGKGGGGARTGIELLDEEARVDEMCRMLGDSSGRKVTREHARDILARARK